LLLKACFWFIILVLLLRITFSDVLIKDI